ncbi:MAG TPA: hypothetical protein VGU68_12585 [Ktedonobacteraceae bacterium]|nr:hypothetical protein [Ktedonobacteraceae bacterium]
MQDNLDQNNVLKDVQMMGIDPDIPFYDLNLAGSQGVPAPSQLAHSTSPETNAPTFTYPNATVPPLAAYDLTEPGIDLHDPCAADPQLPDLADYAHPRGLAIQLPLWPDTATMQASDLPDLQHPDLTQQAHMQERPGDLDASALQVMHQQANYQQLDDKAYSEVFMDQSGMNTSSSRHMDLLMRGLDAEER